MRACLYVRANRCVCVCGRSLTIYGLSWIALPIFTDLTSLLFYTTLFAKYAQLMNKKKHQQQQQSLWADTFDIVIFMFSLKSKAHQSWMVKSNLLHFTLSISLSFVHIQNPFQIKCHPIMSYCHSNCEWMKMITVVIHWTVK